MTDGDGSSAQAVERFAGGGGVPPEPAELVARARALIAAHVGEPPAAVDAIVYWCLAAWMQARFEVSARLILHGRDLRADHARALRLVGWLVPNPRLIVRTTSLHVLDLLAEAPCTLLFDDAAHAILARRDMRALIAAGARRDGAFLVRRARDAQEAGAKNGGAALKPCAAPLALATLRAPPEDVLAHAIVLPMAPALIDDGVVRPPIGEPPATARALAAAFQAFAARLQNQPLVAPALPTFLSAAARETWAPLFALARAVGGDAEEARIRAAASQFAGSSHLEPPTSALALLRDIRRIAGIDGQPVPSAFLVEALTRAPDSPWVACDWGRKLTPRGMAQRLARFDLRPQVIFPPLAPAFRGYKAEALLNAFARYLNDPAAIALLRTGARGEEVTDA